MTLSSSGFFLFGTTVSFLTETSWILAVNRLFVLSRPPPFLLWGTAQAAPSADAVLAASIFHFGQHTIPEAKAFMKAQGIEVRD